jgi:hypothetical protein
LIGDAANSEEMLETALDGRCTQAVISAFNMGLSAVFA